MPPNNVASQPPREEVENTDTDAAHERPRRPWRALVWLVVPGLLLAAALFVVSLVQGRMAAARLEAVRAKVRAAGFAVTPAELEAKLPPVDSPDNGARTYRRAFEMRSDDDPIMRQLFCVDPSSPPFEPTRSLDEAWLQGAGTLLETNRYVLDLLESALEAEYTRFGWQVAVPPPYNYRRDFIAEGVIFGTADPFYKKFRHCARLLFAAAVLHAQRGEAAEALSRIEEMIPMGQSLENDPVSYSRLLRQFSIGCCTHALERVPARCEPEAADLARWRNMLLDEAETLDIRPFIEGEIAHLSPTCQRLRMGDPEVTSAFAGDPDGIEGFLLRIYSADLATDEAAALEALLEIAAKVHYTGGVGYRDIVGDLTARRCFAARALVSQWVDSTSFETARARLLTAAKGVAALRFRRARGRPASSLGDICPSYMRFVPLDPFASGRPLIVKTNAHGVVIYSVGVNRKDDGGDGQKDVVFRVIDRKPERVVE